MLVLGGGFDKLLVKTRDPVLKALDVSGLGVYQVGHLFDLGLFGCERELEGGEVLFISG